MDAICTDVVGWLRLNTRLLLAVLIVIAVYFRIKPKPFPKSIPGPATAFGVGFILELLEHWEIWPTKQLEYTNRFRRTWGGPLPNINGLGGGIFFIADPQNVRHIVRDNFGNYVKGPSVKKWFGDLLGGGIFVSDGAIHKAHRKLAVKFFSRNMLRRASEITRQKLGVLTYVLDWKIDHRCSGVVDDDGDCLPYSSTPSVATADIQDMFYRLTLDIISVMLFDVDLGGIQSGNSQHKFALAFDKAQKMAFDNVITPFSHVLYRLQCTPAARELRRNIRLVHSFADDVIRDIKQKGRKSGVFHGQDLVSRYLQSAKDGGAEEPSDRELRDIVVNLLLAGRDTTACALSWAIYEVTRHACVAEKIREEVRRVLGDDPDKYDLSYDNLGNLEYLHAVVLEVLRLHPSVRLTSRFAVEDDTLPDGTFVPQGFQVNVMEYVMGRSDTLWGRDCSVFRPERFLETGTEPSAFVHIAFWAGYRQCIGKNLAVATMKATLAVLLTRYEFVDRAGHSGNYHLSLVACMQDGFPVEIRRRCSSRPSDER